MNKQDIYTLCTLIPSMDDYSGHNMYLCGKRDGFNECVQMLKDNLKNVKEFKRYQRKCKKRADTSSHHVLHGTDISAL